MADPNANFELIRERLEEWKRNENAILNAALYRSGCDTTMKPLTIRERFRSRTYRARRYFSVLYDALRGVDPYDDYY